MANGMQQQQPVPALSSLPSSPPSRSPKQSMLPSFSLPLGHVEEQQPASPKNNKTGSKSARKVALVVGSTESSKNGGDGPNTSRRSQSPSGSMSARRKSGALSARRASNAIGSARAASPVSSRRKASISHGVLEPSASPSRRPESSRGPRKSISEASRGPPSIAVIFGVEEYTDPRIPRAGSCSRDASVVASHLRRVGFDVTLLVTDGDMVPTHRNILSQVDAARAKAAREDTLLLIFGCARGSVGKFSTAEKPEVKQRENDKGIATIFPADIDSGSLADKAIALSRLKSGWTRTLVILDVQPFLAMKQINSPNGFAVVTGPPSIGTELKMTYQPRLNGLLSHYLAKALEGAAVRDGRITSNSLNIYIVESLARHRVSCTSTAGRELVGDLRVVGLVPKTRKLMREEKELKKFTERWIEAQCIGELEMFADDEIRTLAVSKMMHDINRAVTKAPSKRKRNVRFRSLIPTHVVLVLRGNLDEHRPALFETALAIHRVLGRSTSDAEAADTPNLAELTPETAYTLLPSVGVARNHKDSIAIAVPCRGWKSLELCLNSWHDDRLNVASLPVQQAKVMFNLTLTGSLYDYLRIDKSLRYGFLWSDGISMPVARALDPSTTEQHEAAVKIQRLWRGESTRKSLGLRLGIEELERTARLQIYDDYQIEVGNLTAYMSGGVLAVLIKEEHDVRRDKEAWEREELSYIITRLRRGFQQLEHSTRSRIVELEELCTDESFQRFTAELKYLWSWRWVQLCRRLAREEITSRESVAAAERKEWSDVSKMQWQTPMRKMPKPHALVFSNFPDSVQAGIEFSVTVHIVDRTGMEMKGTSFGKSIALTVNAVVGDGTLSSGLTQREVTQDTLGNACAIFPDLTFSAPGKFTMTASVDGLVSAVTPVITVAAP
eukprot:NODE_103_length_3278_cov_24.713843_g93_i0.p1 GENE.NODE_103_length_3278_cov_24.713843_g93_i0~~NODE_103_length_3278_cov_24.713843_g93_i0.p1  ORF type:complete len:1012 (-),score=184.20 NODE_103_length_3278_cov_24.713843_g93_i0:242-2935(-)